MSLKGENYEKPLQDIRKWCEEFWRQAQFPHFTLHDLKHSDSILEKVERWLSFGSVKFAPLEWFLLRGATYLHDIGMQCRNADFLREYAKVTNPMPLGLPDLELVRKAHAELSRRMILDACAAPAQREYPELRLDGRRHSHAFRAMALLAKGHADDIPAEVTNRYLDIPGGPIRLALLQWLLRVGDALDADAARVNQQYLGEAWTALRPQDRYHALKHHFVSSLQVVGPGVFEFNYSLPEKLKRHYDVIRKCAEAPLRQHLHEAGSLIRDMGLPFAEARSRLLQSDSGYTFEITKPVLDYFHAEACRLSGKRAGGVVVVAGSPSPSPSGEKRARGRPKPVRQLKRAAPLPRAPAQAPKFKKAQKPSTDPGNEKPTRAKRDRRGARPPRSGERVKAVVPAERPDRLKAASPEDLKVLFERVLAKVREILEANPKLRTALLEVCEPRTAEERRIGEFILEVCFASTLNSTLRKLYDWLSRSQSRLNASEKERLRELLDCLLAVGVIDLEWLKKARQRAQVPDGVVEIQGRTDPFFLEMLMAAILDRPTEYQVDSKGDAQSRLYLPHLFPTARGDNLETRRSQLLKNMVAQLPEQPSDDDDENLTTLQEVTDFRRTQSKKLFYMLHQQHDSLHAELPKLNLPLLLLRVGAKEGQLLSKPAETRDVFKEILKRLDEHRPE